MPVYTRHQDFADRYHEKFGKGSFSRLSQLAKQYGVERCEWAVGEMKEMGVYNVGYLAKILTKYD